MKTHMEIHTYAENMWLDLLKDIYIVLIYFIQIIYIKSFVLELKLTIYLKGCSMQCVLPTI